MDSLTALMYILAFLFGITVGSFMNVCILRIPAHESIVTGPSHCPRCGKKLKWYELIPIFSFLALRGRCSNCKLPISAQYPIIEAVNGILWLLIFYVLGFSPYAVLACLMVSALFVLSVIDVRTREIPQGINVFILVLAITAALIDRQNFTSHIIGFFSISVPLYLILIITRGKGIGGGDIKLMAVCGLFLGWKLVVLAFFIGCLAASIIHLFLMTAKKADRSLSFGPYLSAGIFLALLWGNLIIDCYLSLYK
jgi:leader peptidase (prepilin peptidase)/N-methyltransferase